MGGESVKRIRRQEEEEAEDDRLSALPDHLLHLILSSIDTILSARTSILSTRWRCLWIRNPSLFFSDSDTDVPSRAHFLDSVDGALDRYNCGGSLPIHKFHIKITDAPNAARLNAWVNFAAQHDVHTLHLEVPCECHQPLSLPFWMCARKINLEYNSIIRFLQPPLPCGSFGSLKDLILKGVQFSRYGYNFGDVVTFHCPRLESLRIISAFGLKNLNISHPELKLLTIYMTAPYMQQFIIHAEKLITLSTNNLFLVNSKCALVEISAPSLKTLYWFGNVPVPSTLMDLRNLQNAIVLLYSHCEPNTKELCRQNNRKLLSSFSHAQCLHVYMGFYLFSRCVDFSDETAITLPRVKELRMFVSSKAFHMFGEGDFNLLRSCFNIEELHVVILEREKGVANSPNCSCNLKKCWRNQILLLNSLKKVEIRCFLGVVHEARFVKLLLKSATNLETLNISYFKRTLACQNAAKQILKFPRTSSRVIISQSF